MTTTAIATRYGLPTNPNPGTVGVCPYLTAYNVESLNGVRVDSVLLDLSVQPPACFFIDGAGDIIVSVWVHHGESSMVAAELVNRSAPISNTAPAAEPTGWSGGRSGGDEGAVYAVAKGAIAVLVTTTQPQSVKAQRLAVAAIDELGL
ncbi:DUF2020 domain-containing protein [Rhodococcus sp. OK302]|uniref:DUF2020 domain-containing protein n=1 Tax=Rhodococcus sp. OK302 TaxID=1882769 RepID=UPI001596296C|nr:DUF2020 domain-containing protein [Rhodococcus sp. OK302]